ncbi:MAG: energy-coupling factor transporter ATPase [Oscillospiraceae bacterium]|nr:energy-coupling factor transporter ATPase [Oscillospiraceae bacterium]
MPIIETKNLSFIYGKGTSIEKLAIKNINLKIESGEFIGIIGHTGSGKSTLIQQLNGLLKPSSGQILFNGKNIWEASSDIRSIRFKVGMVFQYPEYQLFEETVFKDIAFGPLNMGLSVNEAKKRVLDAANFVGLDISLLERSPFEISGGEKRRAAIAGVIAMDPDVLILDEPTAGLDPIGRDLLLSQITAYHKKRKNIVILISHSMEDIARISNRVLVLNKGEVAMFDKPAAVFARAKELTDIGLKLPQIASIMLKLRNKGYKIPNHILTVEEAIDAIYRLAING